MNGSNVNLDCQSDQEIVLRLKGALRLEKKGLAEFLRVLAEVDARKIHVTDGYSSLFAYCVHGLGFSEDQAYRRVTCARAGRRFPVVLKMIADGRVHMSGVTKLAKHLTEDNHADLLEQAQGKTKNEILLLIATAFPRPDPKNSVKKLAGPKKVDLHEAARFLFGSSSPAQAVEPTSGEVYSFRFRGDAQTKALLDRARDLLGPTGSSQLSDVMALALEALVDKLERQKRSKVNRPGKQHKEATPGDRYVSPQTRREVFTRDSDRCTYVSPEGLRCGCTFGLELPPPSRILRAGDPDVLS